MSGDNKFPSDSELLRRILDADEHAKRLFCEKYSWLVNGAVNRILYDKKCDHIAEVKQAVWYRVYKYINLEIDPERIPAWLVRVAKNESFSHLRKDHKNQHRIVSLDEAEQLPDARIVPIQEEIEGTERLQRVLAVAETISPKFRKILELRLEELTFEEIAELLGENVGNVRNCYYRNLRKLLDMMKDKLD